MRLTFRHKLSLVLALTITIQFSNTSAWSQDPPEGMVAGRMEVPETTKFYPEDIDKRHARRISAKIDPVFDGVIRSLNQSGRIDFTAASQKSLKISDERVHVQIVIRTGGVAKIKTAVMGLGGEATGVSIDQKLIQGWIPASELESLAENPDVLRIRKPAEAVLFEGDSDTEALDVFNADGWQAAGKMGSGVKVAVIDGGFQGYKSRIASGDLPGSTTVKNFVDGESDAQVDGTSPHGTACAEIIYDIAPQAEVFLAKTKTNVDLQEAVAWAKDTHHVDIISTSLGWYNLTPGDGTGEFADLVASARDAGIFWATAAGNDREAHWGGMFYDPDNDGVHEFDDTGQNVNFFGPGNGYAEYLDPGRTFTVFLRWDDWTEVDQDYDLHIVRKQSGGKWVLIAAGENEQTGMPGQTPNEFAQVTTSWPPAAYGFAIVRYKATRDVNLEVFIPKFDRPDKILHSRSLANLADAPRAMTVAALDVDTPYPQESYSSGGPTNGPGGTEFSGFIKPDIAAFANVSTESYGPSGFSGTSAATPHVAGAAALVLSAYPGYRPSQVQYFLQHRARDMGLSGMDPIYGYGRLELGNPALWDLYTWLGASTTWDSASSWDAGSVPGSSIQVLILPNPSNGSNFPVIGSGTNAAANGVIIESGKVIIQKEGRLTLGR